MGETSDTIAGEPQKAADAPLTLEEITAYWIKARNTKAPLIPPQFERRKGPAYSPLADRRKKDSDAA